MSIPGLEGYTDDDDDEMVGNAAEQPKEDDKPAKAVLNGTSTQPAVQIPGKNEDGNNQDQNGTIISSPVVAMSNGAEATEGKSRICGVCKEVEFKYKCSRCYMPYCSIPCLKQHNINHPPDLPKPSPAPTTSQTDTTLKPGARIGTTSAKHASSPFAVLETSKELQALFVQFPALKGQLLGIHNATLRPLPQDDFGSTLQHKQGGGGRNNNKNKNKNWKSHHNNNNQQPQQQQQWTSDRGTEAGIEALKAARKVYGRDGEGIREFGRLVLALLAGEEGREFVEKEVEDESVRVIRQLLEMEGRG